MHQCRGHALRASRCGAQLSLHLQPSAGIAGSPPSRHSCPCLVAPVRSVLEIKDGSCQISQQNCSLKSSERRSFANKTMTNGMNGGSKTERGMPLPCAPAAFAGRLSLQAKPGRGLVRDPPAQPPARPPWQGRGHPLKGRNCDRCLQRTCIHAYDNNFSTAERREA